MRPSSRVAFAISWLVFAVAVVLSWRKVLAAPNGDGSSARCCGTACSWCGYGPCSERVHAVPADHDQDRPAGAWSGPGQGWLATLEQYAS